jgi:hypothetical protein
MKATILILATVFFSGCLSTSYVPVDNTQEEVVGLEDNDKIAVCGEVAGEKQTYPTLGDLKNDGAKFVSYGPCYESE